MQLTPNHRIAILLHSGLTGAKGKTGISLLRYSQNPIVAVIDETCPGASVSEKTGIDREVPVVASVAAALAYQPDVLAIGIAPSGGALPAPWYAEVKTAVAAGLCIMNGLHTQMNADPDLTAQLQPDQWIWDMRQEPPGLTVGSGKAQSLTCRRVLTVGTDMAVGKMSTSLELNRVSQQRGYRSKLIATGQTALMLGEAGVALDAVRLDFAAGAVEQAVMQQGSDCDVLHVEGQGSLMNPASTAVLPLLRGAQPTHLVLVHKLSLTHIQHFPAFKIPPLAEVIKIYETLASAGGTFLPARIVAIALNTYGASQAAAKAAIDRISQETSLPCTDAIRFGAAPILDAIFDDA
ncbi:MAG: DUF1611 domain-containing protein [Leptolyngbya sp. SIO4C1]|nr:DUF1611 domain-containing protein [Leptolyngbya sp. SIO4C1]